MNEDVLNSFHKKKLCELLLVMMSVWTLNQSQIYSLHRMKIMLSDLFVSNGTVIGSALGIGGV